VAIERFINRTDFDSTTVNGSHTAVVTTLAVNANPGVASQWRCLIEDTDEIMIVTAGGNTNSWTVTRGAEGTTAAALSGGETVHIVQTEGSFQQMIADSNRVGTYANLPATSDAIEGHVYHFTSGFYEKAVFNGSTWDVMMNGHNVTVPPTSGWSWVNQGTSTLSTTEGYQTIETPGQAATNLRIRTRSAPSAPYTITTQISMIGEDTNTQSGNIFVRDNSSGRIISLAHTSLEQSTFSITRMNSATSFNSTSSINEYALKGSPVWVRVEDNNTNLIFQVSADGTHWATLLSESRTAWLATPDHIGWGAHDQANDPTINHLIHWEET
jgi:hypothetical protein